MKVIFAIKKMDNASGGAERVLADIMNRFVSNGHTVKLLSFDAPGGESFYPLDTRIERIRISIGNAADKTRFLDTIKRMIKLRHYAQKERPVAVIAFMHSMFIPVAFALFGSGVPVVASDHIDPRYYKAKKIEEILVFLAAFIVERFVVLADNIRLLYSPFIRGRMAIIPDPVTKIKTKAEPIGAGVKSRIILNVGRLDSQKGQKTLIDAFACLAGDFPDWNLRIIGEGFLRSELEEQIRQLDLQDRIQLPGAAADIEREYARAHIFALPSVYESFGMATAEALSAGLPVVGFEDCPGNKNLITHRKNGFLVGERSALALAEGLKSLIQNPELRTMYGEAGQEKLSEFDPEKIFTLWEDLLQDIAAKYSNFA